MNKLDEILNTNEGWTIALNTQNGHIEIQRIDDKKQFDSDREAFIFVVAKLYGDESKRHARALLEVSEIYIVDMILNIEEFSLLSIIGYAEDLIGE
jgi:hypothetical protein